jgi:hypothetical protein
LIRVKRLIVDGGGVMCNMKEVQISNCLIIIIDFLSKQVEARHKLSRGQL